MFGSCAHFGGVARCGSASLGGVGTGGGGKVSPCIQECHLVANVNLHIVAIFRFIKKVPLGTDGALKISKNRIYFASS